MNTNSDFPSTPSWLQVALEVLVAIVIASCLCVLIFAFAGCREPTWSGIPEGPRTCSWDHDRGTCVVAGRAYLCVGSWNIQCAPISASLPEAP